MNKFILKLAENKLKTLKKQYKGFINVGVDNWRGYRFVLDTVDVKKCQNKCQKCALYNLLKKQKKGRFSATLYPASNEDKKLFGKQYFLNCKTLNQYKYCYINFLLFKSKTEKEIKEELNLINNFTVIYSKENSNYKETERKFKEAIYNKVMQKANSRKKGLIKKYFKFERR